ncbi:transposable element Tcb2 transposase [Trichonephila clavipes]|nr:transposable element Tcb2 transposase [Trichonephila clavipes]
MQFGTQSFWVISSILLCCSVIHMVMELPSTTTVLIKSRLATGWLAEHSSDFSAVFKGFLQFIISTSFQRACLSVLNRLQRRAEVEMPLRRFRRQYEQLSHFERERIIGMMEAGWSVRRVVRQLCRSDCVLTASSTAIQAQVAPSLGAPMSSRTIRRYLAEGRLGSRGPLLVLPLAPTNRRLRLKWYHERENWTAAEWNKVVFSDESMFNLSSDDNRVRV